MTTYPALHALNIMGLHTPQSAVLSARNFQCADHHRSGPACAAWCEVSSHQCCRTVTEKSAYLWAGRHHRSFPRNLADRSDSLCAGLGLIGGDMLKQLIPGLRIALVLAVLTGVLLSGIVTGLCQLFFRQQANGSLIVDNGGS